MKLFFFIALLLASFNIKSQNLLPYAFNTKWGLITVQQTEILGAQFDYIEYDEKGKKFIYYAPISTWMSKLYLYKSPVNQPLKSFIFIPISKNWQRF